MSNIMLRLYGNSPRNVIKDWRKWLISIVLLSFSLAGCNLPTGESEGVQSTPEEQEVVEGKEGEEKQINPTQTEETPIEIPSATSIATEELYEMPLSKSGPWLVFHTQEGFWAVNQDGSGLSFILNRAGPNMAASGYHYLPAPEGGKLAIVEIENRDEYTPPFLEILSLPDQNLTYVTVLHPGGVISGNPDSYDRWAATGMLNALQWSPNGKTIAFNGIIDGDSGDLYTYNASNGKLTRLTDGPTESVFPNWSPNGRRIVQGGVERLNLRMSGAGYDYVGVWSVKADDTSVDLLFNSNIVGFEDVLGWQSNKLVLMDTETPNDNPFCSYSDLRRINLDTLSTDLLIPGYYSARAYDPKSETVLFSVTDDSNCVQSLQAGWYIFDLGSSTDPLRFSEFQLWEIKWSPEAELFFANSELGGVMAVATSGNYRDLVKPDGAISLPIAARGTRRLAWAGGGLWIGTLQDNIDQQPEKIHSERVWDFTWSPNGEYLLFMTENGLFVASEPNFSPVQVVEFRGYSPVWVTQ